MREVNLGLRFLLELTAVAVIASWGWKAGTGLTRWALAAGAAAAVVLVWGLFVSVHPWVATPRWLQFVVELMVWAAAGAALHAVGHTRLAVAFFGIAVVSGALNYAQE